MTFGLKVLNTDSIIQVDDNYVNLQLKEKLSVLLVDNTPSDWGGGSNVWRTSRYSIDSSLYPNCVIAVKHNNSNNNTIPLGVIRSDGYWHIDAYSKQANIIIDVYIFSFDGAMSFYSGYGLQVINSAGKETFNSNNKYLRVLRAQNSDYSQLIRSDTITERNFTSFSIADFTGKNLAYCFMNTPFYDQKTYWQDADDEDLEGTDIIQTGTFASFSGSQLSIDYKRIVVYSYNIVPEDEYDRSAHGLSMLLIDVTNY